MEKGLKISQLKKKLYLTTEETVAILHPFYPEEFLRNRLRKGELNLQFYNTGSTRYYRSEEVFKLYETNRYLKRWRAIYAKHLPD